MVSSRSSTAWKEVGEREGTMLVGPCTGDLCLPIWSSSPPSPCRSVIPEAASTNGIKPSGFQLCSANGRPEQDQRTGGERSPSVSSQVPSLPDSFGDGCISPPTRGQGSCGNTPSELQLQPSPASGSYFLLLPWSWNDSQGC